MTPPRDDETTPPDRPRVKTDPTGVRVTERGPRTLDRERDRITPKHGRPVATWDDITGRYEDETERALARARRPTDERIARLEVKHDTLDEKVDRIDNTVAKLDGKMDGMTEMLPQLISEVRAERAQNREQRHAVFKQEIDIGTREAFARIDTQQIATKSKWKIAVRIVTGLFSAGVLGAAIALLAQRC